GRPNPMRVSAARERTSEAGAQPSAPPGGADGGTAATRNADGGTAATRHPDGGTAPTRRADGDTAPTRHADGGTAPTRSADGDTAPTRHADGGTAGLGMPIPPFQRRRVRCGQRVMKPMSNFNG